MSDPRRSRARGHELAEIAGWIGATDLFAFRRVIEDRYVHVGGVGRGEGWAGNIELSFHEEPIVERALRNSSREHERATFRVEMPLALPSVV
jgi:hypothetical protein